MKRLHLFLIKSFLKPFLVSFFVAIFLLLMQFLWKYIDDLVGKGLDIYQVSQLLFYASARFVPLALPIAMLLSTVMMFGKMGENYELVALKSSGISFLRILFPLSIIALLISYGSYLFSNNIMPIANLKNGAMIYDIQKKKPALNIKEGIFYRGIEGYTLKISKKLNDGKTLNDIVIYDHSNDNGNDKIIIAKRGIMHLTENERYLELTLFDGNSYIDLSNQNSYRKINFKKDLIRFDLSSFKQMSQSESLYKGHYAMLNNFELNKSIDSLSLNLLEEKNGLYNKILNNYNKNIVSRDSQINSFKSNKDLIKKYDIAINKTRSIKIIAQSMIENIKYKKIIITKHKIEWHRKLSLSVICFLFFILGSSLGSILQKGGIGLPVLISVFFFLLYHVISIVGEKSAKELKIEAYEGMWLSTLVFTIISIIVCYRAIKDTQVIDDNFLKKIFRNNKKVFTSSNV